MVLKHNEVHPVRTANGGNTGLSNDGNGQGGPANGASHTRKDSGTLELPTDISKDDRRGSDEAWQDVLNVPLSNTGFQKFLPKFLRYKFADPDLEKLYMAYFGHQRRLMLLTTLGLSCLVAIAFLVQYVFDYSQDRITPIALISFFLAMDFTLIILIYFSVLPERFYRVLPYVLWLCLAAGIHIDIGFHYAPFSASLSVGWQILYIFSSYIWLPLGLSWCIVMNCASACVHSLIVGILAGTDNYKIFRIGNQIAANMFLFLCVNVLGTIAYLFIDRKLRRAFLETKSSLSIKVVIEEEYKQQERLLLSVLPKHVASEMVKDMGAAISGQFRKIYMSRHEGVSILFADIVGFTAISSTCTAQELVGILNELFATFDKLAKLYCQLRIKILGDCYYCICGAPEPRSDHAVLSIHMGLAVVEAIRDVREKTKTNVNMRVGIHTGAVLGGVLGQKQWQFDVLGKEVTLANRMESGGIPGRVHISEQTKSFLKEEFELEPGDGDQRDDYLRMTGTATYLVKSVKVPFPEGTLEKKKAAKKRQDTNGVTNDGHSTKAEETETTDINKQKEAEHELLLRKRLYESLMEKERMGELWKVLNAITLRFKNSQRENGYIQMKEHFSGVGMVGLCLVPLACFCAQLCIAPKKRAVFATFVVGEILLVTMTVITLAINYPQTYPRAVVRFSNWVETSWLARSVWGTMAVIIMSSLDIFDMWSCDTEQFYNVSTVTYLEPDDPTCQYPPYFIYFGEISLVGVTLLVQISHILKSILIVIITCAYVLISLLALPALFDRYEGVLNHYRHSEVDVKYTLAGVMGIITIILLQFNRALELLSRRLHYCKEQAEDSKDEVTALRQKNESLVYNILPSHVAKDFIGRTLRDEELYSSSHETVGVMFASCPNFNDFYSEDAINNNGLECLRFLNEIISDYDEMLKEPRFKSITKIKTVQSTYMAASGMMSAPRKGASIKEKWQHLDDLVQFAFSLKETLDKINAQSFNTFVLRIGINHGPIVAGVIGAQKPHYDIWGNTVNVSSRMESTGQAGRMQVVEESMIILKEFGYSFEKRGLVSVKGKGQLLTFFVNNRDSLQKLPNQVS